MLELAIRCMLIGIDEAECTVTKHIHLNKTGEKHNTSNFNSYTS